MKTNFLSNQKTAEVCHSLALLLHTGLSLSDSLFLLAQEDVSLRPALEQMGRGMAIGQPLSEVMAESGIFPSGVIGLVQTGERTGYVEEALSSLADYYRNRDRAERQIRSALTYPALLMILMFAVIGVLLVKVLPVFDDVYASLGGHMTGVAGWLLSFGQLLRSLVPVLWVIFALLAVSAIVFVSSNSLRKKLVLLWRRKTGDRGVSKQFNNARFSCALAMGLRSGLAVEESVALAAALLQDIPAAAERCSRCSTLLEQGHDLADALCVCDLLPASACRMLTLGLRGGNGDQVMNEISIRMMDEAEVALDQTVSRVEPTMVLVASLLVGAILLAVMLPLMNIMSAIG